MSWGKDQYEWATYRNLILSSNLYDKFGIGVGEALELVLVQVHDEELVGRRQLHWHLCELLVEVPDILARFLPQRHVKRKQLGTDKECIGGRMQRYKGHLKSTCKKGGRKGSQSCSTQHNRKPCS